MKKYKYNVFTSKIKKNIKNGILKAADRLPYIRQVKQEYGLGTSSVQRGYDGSFFLKILGLASRSNLLGDLWERNPI